MIKARSLTYEADKLIDVADIKGALELYEQAWVQWDWVFRRFPTMMTDDVGDDVQKSLGRYRKLLDKDLEKSFVLWDFLEVRQFHNNPSAGGDANRIIEEWQRNAGNLSDEPPQPKSETPQVPQSLTPEKTTVPAVNASPDAPPKPEVPVSDANEIPARPPTLENPDSQK